MRAAAIGLLLGVMLTAPARAQLAPDDAKTAAEIAALAQRVDALALAEHVRALMREQRIVQHPLNARLFIESLLLAYGALLRGSA